MFDELTPADRCRVDAYLAAMTKNNRDLAAAVRDVVFEDASPAAAAKDHGVKRTTLVMLAKRFRERFGEYLSQAGRCPMKMTA